MLMTLFWNPDNIKDTRPIGNWAFYQNGVIQQFTEEFFKHVFDNWRVMSDEKGTACFMLDQLWDEIYKLREQLKEQGLN